MANMAEKVWEVAGATILMLLREHKDYSLVLTGHSLGGGTACLLNIMCHQKDGQLVDGRHTQCFAYASPPVFTPVDLVPRAVDSCVNYIHGNDAVPFLSIDSLRRLFNQISMVESHTRRMDFLSRMRLVTGYELPNERICEDVALAKERNLEPKKGAPKLAIPSAANVWLQEVDVSGRYDFKLCDSKRLATLGLQIESNMLKDHFPPCYEHALHNLADEVL